MAKIIFSGIGITEMRGKLGNEVFTKGRGGAMVRSYVVPTNTITANRTLVRAYWSDAVSLWASVDEFQLKFWEQLNARVFGKSAVGNRFKMSTRNLFIKCNYSLLCAENSPILAPDPLSPYYMAKSVAIDTLTDSAFTATVNFPQSGSIVPPDHVLVISASPSVSPSINYARNFFLRIAFISEGDSTNAIDLFTRYFDTFGTPVATQKIFIRATSVNVLNGLSSKPVQTFAIVA